jgi:F-type H+-transporting ATPase subunit b
MNTQNKVLILLLLLPFFLFFSANTNTDTEEESHSSALVGYLGKVLNFLVLFGSLGFFLRKPLKKFLEGRGKDIDSTIKEAKKEREDTEKKHKHSLDRLQKLKEELEEIRKEAEEEGKKRKESILLAAEKETERIKNFSRQEIEMFYQIKIRELKAQTAELATELAKTNIKAKMTPERQSLLIDSSIEKLEDFYGK